MRSIISGATSICCWNDYRLHCSTVGSASGVDADFPRDVILVSAIECEVRQWTLLVPSVNQPVALKYYYVNFMLFRQLWRNCLMRSPRHWRSSETGQFDCLLVCRVLVLSTVLVGFILEAKVT
jgi:hypothetical protein